jgi:Domain of unknown function (DUF5666)
MKQIIMMFVMAAALMMVSGPALAKGSAVASKEKTPAVKALEGLKLRQHSGVISAFDPGKGSLVIKNRKGEQNFSVTADTQIKKGRIRLTHNDLKTGMSVTVRYWEQDGRQVARIVKLSAK